MLRTSLLNGITTQKDKDYTALAASLIDDGVVEGLEVTTNSVATGTAFIKCTRTATTPEEEVMVRIEITEAETIDTSGTKKVWIAIDQTNINDAGENDANGTTAWSIETGASYPSSNYIPLADIVSGVITDDRSFIRIKSAIEQRGDILAEIQKQTTVYGSSSTGNDDYAITLSPIPASLASLKGSIYFLADVANTGAATLNINGLGVKTIKKKHDLDLEDGDIEVNQKVEVVYNETDDVFEMVSQEARVVDTAVDSITKIFTASENITQWQALHLNREADNALDLTNASYSGNSLSVSGQDVTPRDLHFKSDGTKMYMVGATSDDIYQYSLSTAWDLSTASYDSVSLSVSGQDANMSGMCFNSDGTKIYTVWYTGDKIYQYSLSTAWDLSTASYDSKSLNISSQDNTPMAVFVSTDETKIYIVWHQNDTVYQYTLSTAGDVSTWSYASKSFSVSSQEATPEGLYIDSTGTKMVIVGTTNDTAYKYTLSTAWDISTASYDSESYFVNKQTSGVAFGKDGTKMYVTDMDADSIWEYDTWEYKEVWLYVCDASDSEKIDFIGFAEETVTSWNPVTVNIVWKDSNQTGLFEGKTYYLSDTPGEISLTPGTNQIVVWVAISDTEIKIEDKNLRSETSATATTWGVTLGNAEWYITINIPWVGNKKIPYFGV